MLQTDQYKDKFYLTLPKKDPKVSSHLPEDLAKMCEAAVQQPINPHRQRLLTASKRAAKVETGPQSAATSKGGKDGTTANPKRKAKSDKKPKAKPVPRVSAADMKSKAKDDYQGAKKLFLESLLDTKNKHRHKIALSLEPSQNHIRYISVLLMHF